jgi:cold shock CspA family protein
MAPETLRDECKVSFWTDVWSLACVALEILSGELPFKMNFKLEPNDLSSKFRQKITPLSHLAPDGFKQLFEEYDGFVSEESKSRDIYDRICKTFYELLQSCFSFEPKERPTIKTMKECVLKCLENLKSIRKSRFWHVRDKIKLNPSQEDLDRMIDRDADAQREKNRLDEANRERSRNMSKHNADMAKFSSRGNIGNSTTVHDKQTPRQGNRRDKVRTSSFKSGTIKFYNASREFGYITPDDGGKDVRFTKRCIGSEKVRTSSFKSGTIKFYNASREFGYITPDDGGKDVRFTKRCIGSEISLSKIRSSACVEFVEDRRSKPQNRFAFKIRMCDGS